MMKELGAIYSSDEIRRFMNAFFAIEDPFIEQSGHSLGVFRGCLPKVILYLKRQQPKADMNGHTPPCASIRACVDRTIEEGRAERAKARAES